MKTAKLPLIAALHGTSGQGDTDPDVITLFRNWTRLSTDHKGEMDSRPLEGFFQAGTQLVTHYKLRANGRTPIRTYSVQSSSNQWCGVFLVPQTLEQGNLEEGRVPNGSAEVSILRTIDESWTETVRVRSYSSRPQTVELELELGCPIGDVEFEEEMKEEDKARSEGIVPTLSWRRSMPVLLYKRDFGRRRRAPTDELRRLLGQASPRNGQRIVRGVSILFHVTGARHNPFHFEIDPGKITSVRAKVYLPARASMDFSIEFIPFIDGKIYRNRTSIPNRFDPLPRTQSDHPEGATVILTGNSALNQIIAQAQVDLELLKLKEANGLSGFNAGIPRYIGVFGRDSVTTAWQSGLFSSKYLEPVLTLIGRLRGVRYDAWRDEEPDRILHERRLNPTAAVGSSNREIYYGDVAATPFWIVTLVTAYHWTGDREILKRHADVFDSCLRWIERKLNEGNGFIYYAPGLPDDPGSNRNQAWKDSGDAIVDGQGRNRKPPHATAEIQGYAYLALLSAAEVEIVLGRPLRAKKLLDKAASLKKKFNREFWIPEKEFFALALDGEGKRIDAIASNIGHCLGSGLIDHEKIQPVIRRLMSPELFSGWGIRTLSDDNPAYDPFSYHRGSVWPVENSSIAAGFGLCGYTREMLDLIGAQFALATLFPNMRLPEVVSGHERNEEYPVPGLYSQANLLQAWSVSAIAFYLQIVLGIRPWAQLRTLLVKPHLPDWLPWVEIHDLQVANALVSLRFWRDDRGRSHWKILKRRGAIWVVEQPLEPGFELAMMERTRDAMKSTKLLPALVGAGAAFLLAGVIAKKAA